MIDEKKQPNVNERPEQAKPEQENQQVQLSQAHAMVQPGQRTASGRKPLFRS
jgi:hypothetical protein